mmetsp:Transcript_36935/g.87760  ORF Transcript_36935/g.87760 Transcript_36935/m.87760 type:complete len:381 (+) Transcript_36935:463-1605(+)
MHENCLATCEPVEEIDREELVSRSFDQNTSLSGSRQESTVNPENCAPCGPPDGGAPVTVAPKMQDALVVSYPGQQLSKSAEQEAYVPEGVSTSNGQHVEAEEGLGQRQPPGERLLAVLASVLLRREDLGTIAAIHDAVPVFGEFLPPSFHQMEQAARVIQRTFRRLRAAMVALQADLKALIREEGYTLRVNLFLEDVLHLPSMPARDKVPGELSRRQSFPPPWKLLGCVLRVYVALATLPEEDDDQYKLDADYVWEVLLRKYPRNAPHYLSVLMRTGSFLSYDEGSEPRVCSSVAMVFELYLILTRISVERTYEDARALTKLLGGRPERQKRLTIDRRMIIRWWSRKVDSLRHELRLYRSTWSFLPPVFDKWLDNKLYLG